MPNDWPTSNARPKSSPRSTHPNIAAVNGLEQSNAAAALVMELLEGPTLADGIARGAIPLDEARPIAKQIAEALDAVLTTPRTT
jgi:serine/threonine protein kinase